MDSATNAPAVSASVRQLTGCFGGEVRGLNIAALTGADKDWIKDQLYRYKVLVFRNQAGVQPRHLAELGRAFGKLEDGVHPNHARFEDEPSVKILVSNASEISTDVLGTWHTDGSQRPDGRGFVSILQAQELPDYGRDTMFMDMEAMFNYFSPPMQTILEGLTAIHTWGKFNPDAPDVENPVVVRDPTTGRKALYVNNIYTRAIKGMRKDESENLLAYLFNTCARVAEYQLRVSWEPGMIVMWDNEWTQHYIVWDRPFRRVMHRVMALRPNSK